LGDRVWRVPPVLERVLPRRNLLISEPEARPSSV
jgi:hypothetical protein